MRYLVVFTNGRREEVYGKDFIEAWHAIGDLARRYGIIDLVYYLGRG
jgi:hypothetical protein